MANNLTTHHHSGISIQCSARAYLKQFYENLGFKVHGELYEEDGFPHLAMVRDAGLMGE